MVKHLHYQFQRGKICYFHIYIFRWINAAWFSDRLWILIPEPLRGKVMFRLHWESRWLHWINYIYKQYIQISGRQISACKPCSTYGAMMTKANSQFTGAATRHCVWHLWIAEPDATFHMGRKWCGFSLFLRGTGKVVGMLLILWFTYWKHANLLSGNFLQRWWRLVGAPYTVLTWSQLWGSPAKRCKNCGGFCESFFLNHCWSGSSVDTPYRYDKSYALLLPNFTLHIILSYNLWNSWWTAAWYTLHCANVITALRATRHLFTLANFRILPLYWSDLFHFQCCFCFINDGTQLCVYRFFFLRHIWWRTASKSYLLSLLPKEVLWPWKSSQYRGIVLIAMDQKKKHELKKKNTPGTTTILVGPWVPHSLCSWTTAILVGPRFAEHSLPPLYPFHSSRDNRHFGRTLDSTTLS